MRLLTVGSSSPLTLDESRNLITRHWIIEWESHAFQFSFNPMLHLFLTSRKIPQLGTSYAFNNSQTGPALGNVSLEFNNIAGFLLYLFYCDVSLMESDMGFPHTVVRYLDGKWHGFSTYRRKITFLLKTNLKNFEHIEVCVTAKDSDDWSCCHNSCHVTWIRPHIQDSSFHRWVNRLGASKWLWVSYLAKMARAGTEIFWISVSSH